MPNIKPIYYKGEPYHTPFGWCVSVFLSTQSTTQTIDTFYESRDSDYLHLADLRIRDLKR